MKLETYDILILGAGHAGSEAAHIAASFNLRVGLLTLPDVPIASAPCNPSIGGVGKGQVVREIDALGGIMGKIADLSGIQYRTLNESKGAALQSTRVQIDKDIYAKKMEEELQKVKNLSIIRAKVKKIHRIESEYLIETEAWSYRTKRLIVTTGTFLNGVLHCGSEVAEGGRIGADPTDGLSQIFEGIQILETRFKTGTPPRINKDSINFQKLEIQPSDDLVNNFHWNHYSSKNDRNLLQVPCYLTYTNKDTLSIVRENKEKSPMYNGQIRATGARYCPSLEDKAYRYVDKNIHHVFLEPEGLELNTYYPSGISTSLPKEIQQKFVRTISGLEDAIIEQYGYAVEYDVVDTTQLDFTLQMRNLPGLYFAGQVNGTSGYEEAAGQGFIAGANAALSLLEKDPLILSRHDSYIGVMIEDLVTEKRDEPYRLFSARCENRLMMREDNSFTRMYSYRKKMELNDQIDHYHESRRIEVEILQNLIDVKTSAGDTLRIGEVLKQPTLDPVVELQKFLEAADLNFRMDVVREVAISQKYAGYIAKANVDHARSNSKTNLKISAINLEKILKSNNISFECKQRISQYRPQTFEQLQKIPGLRPVTVAVIAAERI
ncbi:MAG: tRNA uridine-5-carboxymethylaminomethyl(34) synthesis enzyme MnmG [Bacteriovoracaceae bacterium]|nr:tRNA uridine-5-carboxymethylaminomethyl(34) synthesis enzyme MnmG [Bacteriovoracaceae bacterium]